MSAYTAEQAAKFETVLSARNARNAARIAYRTVLDYFPHTAPEAVAAETAYDDALDAFNAAMDTLDKDEEEAYVFYRLTRRASE